MGSSVWTKQGMENVGQQGLASTLLRLWIERRTAKVGRVREIELLETLSLGGRRQLILVRCAGERFLVAGSLDRIETMVKLEPADVEPAHGNGLCG
jgi:flagellar biogenesis protein FliO